MTRAENEFDLKMKKVRSDNGSEFRNTRVEDTTRKCTLRDAPKSSQ